MAVDVAKLRFGPVQDETNYGSLLEEIRKNIETFNIRILKPEVLKDLKKILLDFITRDHPTSVIDFVAAPGVPDHFVYKNLVLPYKFLIFIQVYSTHIHLLKNQKYDAELHKYILGKITNISTKLCSFDL